MTAYSRIATAPSPATSGTTISLTENTGDRFPDPPFTALVWEEGTLPRLGASAEELAVLTLDGDAITFTRGGVPIPIRQDFMVASKSTVVVHTFGEGVTLSGDFPGHDPPYTLHLRKPSGGTAIKTAASGVTNDGAGNTYFTFEPEEAGLWRYRWDSNVHTLAEDDFFVPYSDVL